MNRRSMLWLATAAAMWVAVPQASMAQDVIKFADVIELSGAGAAVGTNWRDGLKLAVEEINAAGGILGQKVEVTDYDTQTDPTTSRAMVQKAIDDGAYVIMGPIYSGSVKVNMMVAMQNGVPQISGAEAPDITRMNNPYIFRTSFGAQQSMPKLVKYLAEEVKAKSVAVAWVNDDFGKGGRDSFVKELKSRGITVATDVSSEVGQADFAADVVKLKSSGADTIFAYLHEEESARLLKELQKQGVKLPIFGETTLMNQKVVDLAGDAVNGVRGHVGLMADAPVPGIQEFAKKFQAKYNYKPDHNAIKAYLGAYAVKYVTTKNGKVDRQALADTLHGLTITPKDEPGILIETSWDDKGEVNRDSFLVEVEGGKQVVVATIPKL
ncbi:amino acid ABC transporter substrate-binding protein [Agrobacterium rhizogenes]|uniref:Amino acid ABC transporter n=1 Tax=Rhizobium rhizogenes (strain K84 / ATCC BAA-868) TaxID=311403 RepID=B9JJ94_RHIR8|nr:ABC transporter substrate-binding protein [Rhizobium rhizogenes]ACM29986.1 amino acid ABC transporter [Rhizobium rhizogenes K84]OCJ10794.1 ABC transporter substrate-binding protein [Agrobacterium sp. B131/95]OCJ15637.1 ABC transporter substrate-binding protein [Agrobacterium sp. B133/95]KEA09281.1 ABC transporter substrate-binding protein [Rhizobium rhizogenes]MDJ1636623.1 ABC transporter substrate-binding protein [Rhizobium rhizogenes]